MFAYHMRVKIALDIAKGLNYLHTQKPPIIHRDVRSPNIFMASLSMTDSVLAKVGDFGLALKLAPTANARLGTGFVLLDLYLLL